MYLNKFSVRIPEGQENTSGYVEMVDGTQYTIVLRNDRDVHCDANVEVDGKHIGTFRIWAHSNIKLERPLSDSGKFTFFRTGSYGFLKSDLARVPTDLLGLVKVTFTPEKRPQYYISKQYYLPNIEYDKYYSPSVGDPITWIYNSDTITYTNTSACSCSTTAGLSASPGGTGLSGHSDQGFYKVDDLHYDFSQQTTIYIRLICSDKEDPRPLRPVMNSTPIPPRI